MSNIVNYLMHYNTCLQIHQTGSRGLSFFKSFWGMSRIPCVCPALRAYDARGLRNSPDTLSIPESRTDQWKIINVRKNTKLCCHHSVMWTIVKHSTIILRYNGHSYKSNMKDIFLVPIGTSSANFFGCKGDEIKNEIVFS